MLRFWRNSRSTGPAGILAMEVLVLVAEAPRTIEELSELTGAANGRINKVVRQLTPWWDRRRQEVIRPEHWFLQRRRRPGRRGYRIHLTSAGRAFLAANQLYDEEQ
jgi:hypothetical protein